MIYYALSEANTKIGRCSYPQVQGFESEPGRMVTDPDFVYQLRGNVKHPVTPYAGTLFLQKGANATDFLSCAHISWAFVCTDKVEKIIRQFNYGQTDFYPLSVKHRDAVYSHYKLMHCVNNYTDIIDYKRSDFKGLRIHNNVRVAESYPVKDLDDLQRTQRLLLQNTSYGDWRYIEPFVIRLKDVLKPRHDIFNLWPVDIRTFISEPLKEAFDKAKITGVQYNFDKTPVLFE